MPLPSQMVSVKQGSGSRLAGGWLWLRVFREVAGELLSSQAPLELEGPLPGSAMGWLVGLSFPLAVG